MITLRPAEEKDHAFIEKVYRSTREEELKLTDWTELQKRAFVLMQLKAQLSGYKTKFPGTVFQIIMYKKKPAGRFYTWENENEIRIIDITLLQQFRGKGIGTFLLDDLIKRSNKIQKIISLHVLPSNPAMSLYRRMGFIHIKNNGLHYYMERNPEVK